MSLREILKSLASGCAVYALVACSGIGASDGQVDASSGGATGVSAHADTWGGSAGATDSAGGSGGEAGAPNDDSDPGDLSPIEAAKRAECERFNACDPAPCASFDMCDPDPHICKIYWLGLWGGTCGRERVWCGSRFVYHVTADGSEWATADEMNARCKQLFPSN